jgi:signal transduction histidine kinase
MARIIDDVLDLCRSAHGKLTLRREWVDVSSVIDSAVAAVRPALIARSHQLTLQLPPSLPRLEAEAFRLEQVLTNLLANAAKFTEPGGHIFLAVQRTAHTLTFRVRDDGIGISRELLPHVFDPYRQGAPQRNRGHSGLGIGLTLVRSLVELMGGSVWATSGGEGTGAEFIVRLPIGSIESGKPRRD